MAVPELDTAFEGLCIANEKPEPAACLPFRTLTVNAPIDRYLFRIFDSNSDGDTTEEYVKSRDACVEGRTSTQDIFERTDKEAVAEMVNRHLRWDCDQDESDNLVSWTSSLLFALQYAIFRHLQNGTALADIQLCVVDTKRLPKDVFIRDLDLIRAYVNYDNTGVVKKGVRWDLRGLWRLRHKKHRACSGFFYFGEYLSQGILQVEGNSSTVKIRDLVDTGLFELRPQLQQADWANATINLRQVFYDYEDGIEALDRVKVDIAMKIGDLFGPRWKLPIATAFIALQHWEDLEGPLLTEMTKRFKDIDMEEFGPEVTKIVAPDTMPELQQYAKIRDILYFNHLTINFKSEVETAIQAASGIEKTPTGALPLAPARDAEASGSPRRGPSSSRACSGSPIEVASAKSAP